MSRFPKASFGGSAIVALAVCILVVAASPALHAWWVTDGAPVCTAIGTLGNPLVASDGAGGAIIAWADASGGGWDVYAQRVSASGNALWTANGVGLCVAVGSQLPTAIVSDGAGGAIVAWYDSRSGTDDIYAQRVNASGAALWTADGVALCTAAGTQQFPCIASDGSGGAFVAWQDYRSGTSLDVYVQRVSAYGVALLTLNGMALCTATGSQNTIDIASDGGGGAIVSWEDGRTSGSDVYAQRVDAIGNVKWGVNGRALCTTVDDQNNPVIAADGAGGAIVAWQDERGAYDNIYAQRANASGAVQWVANGIPVCAQSYAQHNQEIVSDGADGAIVLWQENRGSIGVYGQRLSASGGGQWPADGILLCGGISLLSTLDASPDGLGGAIVAWHDSPGDFYDVFAQRVDGSGALPWSPAQLCFSAAVNDQMYPSAAPDGLGGAIVVWRDERAGENDAYAHLADAVGRLGWLAPDVASVQDVPGDQGGSVFLAWDAARADLFMDTDAELTHYSIWRSISSTQAALAIRAGASEIASLAEIEAAPSSGEPVIRVEETGALTIYWQLVATQEALYMEGYGMPVETLFDSSAVAGDPHYFQVVAHTTDPIVFWKSAAVSGWSVDNLAPAPPVGLAGEQQYTPAGLELSWRANGESDLAGYAIYRGTSTGFAPGPENLVASIPDTLYLDGSWSWSAGYYYKVAARDIHGNESGCALLSPDGVTGDETPTAPAASFLAQNFPNPFNPTTRIAFGLAAPSNVSLRIFDVSGRLVRTLAEGERPAGNYSEFWDGRDARGAAVSSGIYFYRLKADSFERTMKMVLIR